MPKKNPQRTTRRESPEVYRQRRLMVVASLLGAIILLGIYFWRDNEKKEQAAQAQAEASSVVTLSAPAADSSESAAAATSAIAPTCDMNNIKVEAAVDQEVYTSTDRPKLSLKVTNVGSDSCLLNVGTSQQTFTIAKKGGDKIWTSKDCQENTDDEQRLMTPNKTEVAIMTWNRVLSKDGCAVPDGVPQPGQYTLTVQMADKQSNGVDFVLQ
ncbi:MAG: hypothetical protein QM632_04715 [Micrococcaceae bacterium]